MKGFGFSLAPGSSLHENADGYFLISHRPVRILRLNRSLFHLIAYVHNGGELSEFVIQNPGLKMTSLLKILLSLVASGYLKLVRVAEIESFPLISIIIPVRDQADDLAECLHSLVNVDYPKDRLEIIVVDDGSRKKAATDITSPDIRIIRQEKSLGPATCRNIGAENARGDILAFIDADCMAGKNWLKEIVPFFQVVEVGAVGGYVEGYYRKSLLDRYEAIASSLNMGERIIIESKSTSGFYVPTANMLVDREAFKNAGSFQAGLYIGEDVDFCWRLKNLGLWLLYVPLGKVAHKHRNRLDRMLKRRLEYGTSEAGLYRAHRDKKKTFSVSIYSGLSFLSLALSILFMNPYPLIVIPILFVLSFQRTSTTIKKFKTGLSFPQIALASLRSHLSFFYFALFHLIRYYLLIIIALGIAWHPLWILGGLALIYTSIVDYYVKKPGLLYPFFLFFYLSEHLAYQVGVFWGCLKAKYFGSYLLSFKLANIN